MDHQFALADMPVPLVYAVHRIIRDCNAAFAQVFGYERAELIQSSFAQLYPTIADFELVGRLWRRHLGPDRLYYDERIMARRDGTRFWCQVRGRAREAQDPLADAIYCFEPLQRPVGPAGGTLTDRQRQVLSLIAQGKTSAMIAMELGLSPRSVESHRARLIRAVGVSNTAELIAWFSAQGRG